MDYFRSSVLGIHRKRISQTPFPEVRVEEIWADFLRSRTSLGADTAALPGKTALAGQATLLEQAALAGRQESLDDQAEELALRFELTVNPVYPMPGVGETLGGLKRAGYILGLISNAQFFTPLLFDALLGASPEALGFDPSLLIYSYEIGEAKPATRLFSLALDRLAPRKIGAENCLYVGNDMRNDIYGAASAGYQTALFAGDSRSLRLREAGQDPPGTILPSVVIRHLTDLLSLPAAGTVVRRDGI
jgi:putative hydrolase of the HAD superfamily